MKRIILTIVSLCIVVSVFSGCTNSKNPEAYEKAAKKFLTVLFTYQDAEKIKDDKDLYDARMSFIKKMKPYMTTEGHDGIVGTRDVYRAVSVGFYNKSKVTAKEIELKYQTKDSSTDGYVYNYTVKVNIEPFNGGASETVEVWGQLQVKKSGLGYKINRIGIEGSNKWFDASKGRVFQ